MTARWTSSRVVLIGLALPVWACGSTQQETLAGRDCAAFLSAEPGPSYAASEPFQLIACPLRGSIDPGDPVKVMVVLHNTSGGPVWVRHRLVLGEGLQADVTAPSGRPAAMDGVQWEPGFIEDSTVTAMVITRNGFVGRIIDLACDVGDFDAGSPCVDLYDFSEAGTYTVRLSHLATWCSRIDCSDLRSEPIHAEPFALRVRRE
jgi:hypothetical protein